MQLSENDNKVMEELQKALSSLQKPCLDAVKKQEVRSHLLSFVRADAVKTFAQGVSLSEWAKKRMRENILDYVESSLRWKAPGYSQSIRWTFAMMLLFVFSLTTLVIPFQVPVTYARDTTVGTVEGDVLVFRNTGAFLAQPHMKLQEGDTILTRGGSSVTIHFLDESLSRLGENTSLEVKKLSANPVSPTVTDVRLFLDQGRLWTRVVSLVDEQSRFIVATPSAQAEVETKAAFDVTSSDSGTQIAVFDNVVTVSATRDVQAKTLVAGYSAEVDSSAGNVTIERLPKHEMSLQEKSPWAVQNLLSDEEYRKSLEKEKEDMISRATEDGTLSTEIALENVEARSLQDRFMVAFGVLVKAEANLVRGAREEALAGLQEFELSSRSVLMDLDEFAKKDPVAAGLVRDTLREKIVVQLKDFAAFRPGHRLYRAKEMLRDTELLLARTSLEKAATQLSQAGDMLIEIEDMVHGDGVRFVGSLLDEYQRKANAFTALMTQSVEQYTGNAEEGALFADLIARQAQHMKILTATEQSLVHVDQKVLRERVWAVRKDTLTKFLDALTQTPYPVDPLVLYELKDLYATYGEDLTDEQAMLNPAVDKFLIEVSSDEGGGIDFAPDSLSEIPATMDSASAGWLGKPL